MLVELGPVDVSEVQQWTRIARRLVTELRTNPADLEGIATEDLLGQWSKLIDAWALASTGTDEFRWSQAIDSDLAEFLLHGLDRCFHSSQVQARITSDELSAYLPFTMHVLHAFVDGLSAEGGPCVEYVEQLKGSLGDSLD